MQVCKHHSVKACQLSTVDFNDSLHYKLVKLKFYGTTEKLIYLMTRSHGHIVSTWNVRQCHYHLPTFIGTLQLLKLTSITVFSSPLMLFNSPFYSQSIPSLVQHMHQEITEKFNCHRTIGSDWIFHEGQVAVCKK